ncbi:response regulator receiver domain-containing protein [Breoghania corrubedonensis]|uniref:Response regulator receiver domain-containing protein n=1 Tax=Breoghania corrubedonensis TaxID=665038 RepID=A0A2T5V7R9_9HYPH|nr:response regulator [Breoghania corrubedonensis]PTW59797.1 response regulator receiver domain-containing protein [Breoghania corrubedonensis]
MKRILVIDDDELIRSALQAALGLRGFRVRLAKDGAEGMREISRQPVDLIFVDVFMPAMDGFEFIRALRKADHQTPVIVMSGMRVQPPWLFGGVEVPDYLRMAKALGAVRALQKPFSPEELTEALDASLGASGRGDVGRAGAADLGDVPLMVARR